MKKFFITFAVAIAALFSIQAAEPVKIIFDTDMGNDVDDVVALDMLYKYVDEGTIDLLGILSSKRELGSIKFIDAMNTIYGYPNIPIGIVSCNDCLDVKILTQKKCENLPKICNFAKISRKLIPGNSARSEKRNI